MRVINLFLAGMNFSQALNDIAIGQSCWLHGALSVGLLFLGIV